MSPGWLEKSVCGPPESDGLSGGRTRAGRLQGARKCVCAHSRKLRQLRPECDTLCLAPLVPGARRRRPLSLGERTKGELKSNGLEAARMGRI